jgi:hypothetical protein
VCRQDLRPLGEETSERYECVPAQLTVIEDICKKYACACTVKAASKPAQPIEKSTAGASLLARGIGHLYLPKQAIRDYFYFGNRKRTGCEEQTLYDLLCTVPTAGPGDLRLALKVRLLELQTDAAPKDQVQAVERAFNLLAHPDLRSCYQALLLDPEAPALFPYGGFGSLLVSGELSLDRETFFGRRILSFLPDRRERRFRAPLRKVEFYDG